MKKRQIVVFALVIGCLCCRLFGQDKPVRKKATPAEKAGRLHTSAMSRYRGNEWREAAGLLEKYVKDYPSHEYVVTAYSQLAYCRQQLKDFAGYEKALDEVIRRFVGSPAWYIAHGSKLARRKALKDNDGYLTLLESMLRRAPEAPLFLHGSIGRHHGTYSQYEYYPRFFEPVAARMGRVDRGSAWVMDIVEMADTPERAERALKALAKTLRLREKELPPQWQFAHVTLLKNAGKAELAEKAFGNYLNAWGDDPRAVGLWLLKIADAEAREDEKTVKPAYEHLVKTYAGVGSKNHYDVRIERSRLERALYQRLSLLCNQDRYEEFTELARYYLKTYTASGLPETIIGLWAHMAQRKARKGDASGIPATLEMLDEFSKSADPLKQRSNLIRKIELYVLAKDYDKAAKLAAELVSEKHWSVGSFSTVEKYARGNQAFEKVLVSARTKWKIPVPNPTGKSAVLLGRLKGRLKDNQTRHAEEIGQEMFAKYRADASTIKAVKLLADYYFKHVVPEPRDRWMAGMVKTYPHHPLTEAVLRNQITAERAARRYDRLAAAIDTLRARFGGTNIHHDLYRARLACYDAAKDSVGKRAFVRQFYGARAADGEIGAIAEIAGYELAGYDQNKDHKVIGDYWLAKARKLAGKRAELFCLAKAWNAYFYRPCRIVLRPENICRAGAKTAIEMMQSQKMDPELQWAMAFSDVNLLAYCDDAEEAVKTLDAHLAKKPTWRDLSLRLDFATLGSALGKRKMKRAGLALAAKMRKACFTRRDKLAIELMLASMYNAGKDYIKASKHYLKIVDGYPVPARMYPFFKRAMLALREAKSPRYPAEMERYMRKINNVQDLVPGLMSQLGGFYLGKNRPAAMRIYKKLVKRYPASNGRDSLGKAIERRRK